MTPEKQVQNKIIAFLKTRDNIFVERRNAGGFGYRAGVPDVWFVYRGCHAEVEVKASGGSAGSLQLKHEDKLRAAGALYWRGNSFSDFADWFAQNFPGD